MKRILIVTFSMMLIGIGSMSFAQNAIQNNQTQQVQVEVDGLSCPFCAYGLEKKLKSIEGVGGVKIYIDKGVATLQNKKERSIAVESLDSVVEDAGFTPRQITATAVGTVAQNDGTLVFSVTGSDVMFIINDNAEFQKLTSALKGSEKRVRITARLAHDIQEGHQAHPYTLTIEKFEVI